MKIFISHSSKDKIIADAFVEQILISGCGISEKDIFCSSIEGLGIRTGNDFREHILNELLGADYSFLLISNNYKKSDICLNEMGASWAINSLEVKPFLFPNIEFNSIGTLYSVKQASKLNDGYALDELFEEITTKYNINKSITRWNKYKSNFLETVEKYRIDNLINISPSPDEYFNQFIKENISINNLFLKAHPTLLDCKAVFSKDYYVKMFQRYCMEFEQLSSQHFEPLFPKYKTFRYKTNSSTEIMHGNNKLAGGMKMAADKGAFNYDVLFYKVEFLNSETSEYGNSFSVFCYINNKWVFFPKPWWGIV